MSPDDFEDATEVLGLCPACGVVVDRRGGCVGCVERRQTEDADYQEAYAASRGEL